MKVIIILSLISYGLAKCNVPPSHWCDSVEIARSCGAEKACISYSMQQMNAKPVNITLYYESLCPYCKQFITEQFYPVWKVFMSSGIMVGDMIPYGNAKEAETTPGHFNYTCQHGPKECTGNLIENCLQKYTHYVFDTYFPIIHCMELADDPVAAAKNCITKGNQDWDKIDACAKGKEGNELMHKSALRTGALQPQHKYVPWILVNGEHTEGMQQEAQSNLKKVVCDTYSGEKPKECMSGTTLNKCFREK